MIRRLFLRTLSRTVSRTVAIFLIGTTASLGAVSTSHANAVNEAAADSYIAAMIGDMESLLAVDNGDLEARTQAVTSLLDNYFDFPGITRFSAGPYWRAASEAEKAEYELVIRQIIIGTVVRNFDQLKGLSYAPKATTARGKKLVRVTGEFSDATGARPNVMVHWRVVTRPDAAPKVLDILIENISMLDTQKQENVAIIRKNKGSFAALITAMREKLAD